MKFQIFLFTILFSLFLGGSQSFAQDQIQEYTVGGLKVIHKPSVKETVSVRLFVKGGVNNYPAEKQGIEALAFNVAMSGGTKATSKDQFTSRAENLGTSFSSNSGRDYGHMSMTCLKMNWDESWKLFSEAVLSPAMPQNEFDNKKEQFIANSRQRQSNPDAFLSDLMYKNSWEGSNYAKQPDGTPETLQDLTLEEVVEYYKGIVGKQRSFLVIVGGVSSEDVKKKIEATLAKLPDGTKPEMEENDLKIQAGASVEQRDIETNYILGVMNAPDRDSEEWIHNQLAMSLLSTRYFTELRTKRSLSYAPGAYAMGGAQHPANAISISTTDPEQSMQVMVDEINKIKKEGFSKEELDGKKLTFLTNYFMNQQTSEDISLLIGSYEVAGDWKGVEKFSDRVTSATLDQVNNTFKKYSEKINWNYLGKEDAVKPEFFLQPDPSTPIKK